MIRSVFGGFPAGAQALAMLRGPLVLTRTVRNQAFDATYDQDELAEARKWHSSFRESNLPKGQTSYSRSSGPGGQHVNK
jgi:peptidyl-tRNA hydrolase ICT1